MNQNLIDKVDEAIGLAILERMRLQDARENMSDLPENHAWLLKNSQDLADVNKLYNSLVAMRDYWSKDLK